MDKVKRLLDQLGHEFAAALVLAQTAREDGRREGYAAGVAASNGGALLEEVERLRRENRSLRQQISDALGALGE